MHILYSCYLCVALRLGRRATRHTCSRAFYQHRQLHVLSNMPRQLLLIFRTRIISCKVPQYPPGYCATLLYPVSRAYRPCAGDLFALSPYNTMVQYLIIVFVSSRHPSGNPLPASFILEAHKHSTYIELGSGAGLGTSAALTMR